MNLIIAKLIPKRKPTVKTQSSQHFRSERTLGSNEPSSRIVLPAENLYFSTTRTHPFNHAIHLVGFSTRLADLANDYVGIEATIDPRGPFEVPILIQDCFDAD